MLVPRWRNPMSLAPKVLNPLSCLPTPPADGDAEWMTVLDFAQGFGAVQMSSGMPTNDAPLGAFYHENSLTTDGRYYYSIYVEDPSKDVSVTVAWYDPPSSVSSYNVSIFSRLVLRLPPPPPLGTLFLWWERCVLWCFGRLVDFVGGLPARGYHGVCVL